MGQAGSLPEAALACRDGGYVTAPQANATNTLAALASQLPASYDQTFASVSTINMAGERVSPLTQLDYLYLPKDVTSKGDRGAFLQGLARMALSADGQALISGSGLRPLGNSVIANTGSTSLGLMSLGAPPYQLEATGVVVAGGAGTSGISGNRQSWAVSTLSSLQAQVASLQSQVARSAPKLLRGSGSSAVATVMWKLLDQLSAMASNPVWMTYRGVGSGIGENEVVGTATNAYTPAVHFGCSDVPMSKASYQALVIQVPIAVSPMNFFVGIPPSALAANGGVVKLSACTVAKIMTGTIRSWDDPAITADGNAFPARPITYFFRSGNSGTTAVITAYLFAACPTVWTSPSSRSFPAAFAANGNATGSTSSMATESRRGIDDRACDQEAMVRSVRQATGAAAGCCWLQLATKPWSVGYLEVGNGASAPGVTEVSLQNAAGNYLMSSQSDVSAAASQLFQAGGWPTDPTADFSAVTVVNQPGATTWPIASLPFMFVRLDMTTAGDSGALLVALVNYLLRPSTQASMPLLGLQALPLDVLGYTVSRALPLIVPDMRASKWMYELAAAQYLGAGDFVMTDPSLKTTYLLSESIALRSSVATLAGAVLNQTSNINVTCPAGQLHFQR
ncbi:hypothetical protein QJQ45_024518 [Haematococcus lacustris]|nr:hypothetical protein QJQ45_024518 [Haematococcus lacustris]